MPTKVKFQAFEVQLLCCQLVVTQYLLVVDYIIIVSRKMKYLQGEIWLYFHDASYVPAKT